MLKPVDTLCQQENARTTLTSRADFSLLSEVEADLSGDGTGRYVMRSAEG